MSDVNDKLTALQQAPRSELLDHWETFFRTTVPKNLSTKLLRRAVVYELQVADNGFVWNGKTFKSLSAITKDITGAHWSGPRFFGLNSTPKQQTEPNLPSASDLQPTLGLRATLTQ